jgi:hypothetical protein
VLNGFGGGAGLFSRVVPFISAFAGGFGCFRPPPPPPPPGPGVARNTSLIGSSRLGICPVDCMPNVARKTNAASMPA